MGCLREGIPAFQGGEDVNIAATEVDHLGARALLREYGAGIAGTVCPSPLGKPA